MRRFSSIRSALLVALSVAVTAQPLAGIACDCDRHGGEGETVAALAMGEKHGRAHGLSHGEAHGLSHGEAHGLSHGLSHGEAHGQGSAAPSGAGAADGAPPMADGAESGGCETGDSVCGCSACGHFFGMIVQPDGALGSPLELVDASPPRYLEPLQSQAFRPPIRA